MYKRRTRQDDTIRLKLFTTAMKDIYQNLNWFNVHGLRRRRFADDIVLISVNFSDIQSMLKSLHYNI